MQSKFNGQVLITQHLIFNSSDINWKETKGEKKFKWEGREKVFTWFKVEGNFLLKLINRRQIKNNSFEKSLEKHFDYFKNSASSQVLQKNIGYEEENEPQ